MTNREKYRDMIMAGNFDCKFVRKNILKADSCSNISYCTACEMRQVLWLDEEAEEEQVDWSKVKVDTPIYVKNIKEAEWQKRHFAGYKNGNVSTYVNGTTSWTHVSTTEWNYAKLAEGSET